MNFLGTGPLKPHQSPVPKKINNECIRALAGPFTFLFSFSGSINVQGIDPRIEKETVNGESVAPER
jgi:hypothetical protein